MSIIVAFVSQKGGVGKSTLTRALAREVAKGGMSCKVADLDTQQGTTSEWQRNRANSGHQPRVPVEIYSSAQEALADSDQFEMFILDGPARTSKATLNIAQNADIVVQPTGASLDDLVPAVREYNALVKAGVPRSRLVFALNHIATPAEEAATRDYLEQANFEVLTGCLFEKAAYRQAQNRGLAITETNYSGLNAKADALIQDLINRLGE